MKQVLFGIAICLVVTLSFLLGRRVGRNGQIEPFPIKVDTLFIRDTIVATKPIYVTKRVVDSVLVPVGDTIRLRDTLYIALEREQVRWEDSLAVVWASGVRPQVDSVHHFREQVVITKETPVPVRSRWGIGINAGYGFGKNGLSPYVGVGVSYNLLSF